jgi:predicted O-methyltransferase YrrM
MKEIDWRSCQSMAEEPEQIKLEEWIRDHATTMMRDLFILEIGSYHGQSTAILAQFGRVFAVDLWGNVDNGLGCYNDIGQHHFTSFIQNMIRLKLIEEVIPIASTSKFLDFMPFMNFDIIFIDASHQYDDVKLDINRSMRHLSSDGLFIFDDYKRPGWGYPPYDPNHPYHGPTDPWVGVAKAIDELLEHNIFEIKEHFKGKLCLRRRV